MDSNQDVMNDIFKNKARAVVKVSIVSSCGQNEERIIRGRPVSLLGAQWHAEVRASQGNFGVFLMCSQNEQFASWKCSINMVFGIRLHTEDVVYLTPFVRCDFPAPCNGGMGYSPFRTREQLLDPANGFVKDDAVVFEITFDASDPYFMPLSAAASLTSKYSLERMFKGQPFTKQRWTDAIVEAGLSEDDLVTFHVHVNILCAESDEFETLFSNQQRSKKKSSRTIRILGFTGDQMRAFLTVLYDRKKILDYVGSFNLLSDIYRLADEYSVEDLCSLCMTALDGENVDEGSLCDLYSLGQQYNLDNLMTRCLDVAMGLPESFWEEDPTFMEYMVKDPAAARKLMARVFSALKAKSAKADF